MIDFTFTDKEIKDADMLEKALNDVFALCDDFLLRDISNGEVKGFFCCFKNISDRRYISERVVNPVVSNISRLKDFRGDFDSLLQSISVKCAESVDDIVEGLLYGNALCAIYSDKLYVSLIAADSINGRTPDEPNSDVTVKGPKVGFVEDIESNMAQLRRIIRSENLKFIPLNVGTVTKTRVCIAFVNGRADMNIVEKIKKRLCESQVEYVVDSGNIEQLLEKKIYSILPIVGSTEKVDKVASKMLSGRIAILCDGSPFVLTAPYLFVESLQSSEDYTKSMYYASFLRLLRAFALLASLFLPAIYISVMYYHSDFIPKAMYDSITKMDKDIPVSIITEVIIMLLAFEIVREVGLRMPRTIGDTVGIVGSIVLGDAAVEAGFASTFVLIITAFSAVAGFIIPTYMNSIALMRFVFIFAAYFAGFYGTGAAAVIVFTAVALKKSFGVPYLYPFIPLNRKGLLDTLAVVPKKILGRKEI